MRKISVLKHRVYGEKNSLPALVFVHGWPDDGSVWDLQIAHFGTKYQCVVVTLPNFDESESHASGLNHLELVDCLRATVHEVSPDRPVILVGHDWGAYLSYFFENKFPQKVCGLITMDVGGNLEPNGIFHGLALTSYQLWLVGAWLMRKRLPRIANEMSKLIARLGGAPQIEKTRTSMNYPYYFMWRALLNKNHSNERLRSYHPLHPILYLYGAQKPFHFHSNDWIRTVETRADSRVVAIPAAHWLLKTAPRQTNEAIDRWLDERWLNQGPRDETKDVGLPS